MRQEFFICDICHIAHDDPGSVPCVINISRDSGDVNFYQVCEKCVDLILDFVAEISPKND